MNADDGFEDEDAPSTSDRVMHTDNGDANYPCWERSMLLVNGS